MGPTTSTSSAHRTPVAVSRWNKVVPVIPAEVAPLGRRAAALLVDQAAVLVVLAGVVGLWSWLNGSPAAGLLVSVVAVIAVEAAQSVAEAVSGATLGGALLGVRTVSASTGWPAGLLVVLARRGVLVVAGTILPVVGAYLVVTSGVWDPTPARRGWHDRLTGALVLRGWAVPSLADRQRLKLVRQAERRAMAIRDRGPIPPVPPEGSSARRGPSAAGSAWAYDCAAGPAPEQVSWPRMASDGRCDHEDGPALTGAGPGTAVAGGSPDDGDGCEVGSAPAQPDASPELARIDPPWLADVPELRERGRHRGGTVEEQWGVNLPGLRAVQTDRAADPGVCEEAPDAGPVEDVPVADAASAWSAPVVADDLVADGLTADGPQPDGADVEGLDLGTGSGEGSEPRPWLDVLDPDAVHSDGVCLVDEVTGEDTSPWAPHPVVPRPRNADDVELTRQVERLKGSSSTRMEIVFDTGERVRVSGVGAVGRDLSGLMPRPAHQVVVHDPGRSVSRLHLRFGVENEHLLWVADERSTNGTSLVDPSGRVQHLPSGGRGLVGVGWRIRFGDRMAHVVAVPAPVAPVVDARLS